MKTFVLAAAAGVALSSAASAVIECAIDINSLTASFVGTGPFGLNATGAIHLSNDGNSTLNGVAFDGQSQAISATLSSFVGTINLVNGFVTGGDLHIVNSDASTYDCLISGLTGQVTVQAGQGFKIDGLTYNGLFGSSNFAGANVLPWFLVQPDKGNFLTFKFAPDADGRDTDADIDLAVTIPLPHAAGLGVAGLMGLAARRRR